MTGTQLATTNPTAVDAARADDDRRWANLTRRATALSKAGNLVPKDIRGNPDAALAACIVLDGYGVAISPVTLKQLHFIDGVPDPSAQLQAGLLGAHGYHIDWIAVGPQRCEARLIRPDGTVTTSIAWTLDQARQAGLLDEWVERWVKNGDRNRLEKFTLGRAGVDTPAWAADLVKQGLVKRNENWHRYPDDMLASKVVRRLVKRFAANITLGVDAFADLTYSAGAAPDQPGSGTGLEAPAGADDDDTNEAVAVEASTGPGTTAPAGPDDDRPDTDDDGPLLVDGKWLQRFAIRCHEAAPEGHTGDDVRHAIALTVTKGLHASSKELHAGDQADLASRWVTALAAGRARIVPNPVGEGHIIETVRPEAAA